MLTVDQVEFEFLTNLLNSTCEGTRITDLGESPTVNTMNVQQGVTTSAPQSQTASESSKTASGCHPAYEPCLPNKEGDALNCGDLSADQKPVRVKVIGVDPYKLDRDNNGEACTS